MSRYTMSIRRPNQKPKQMAPEEPKPEKIKNDIDLSLKEVKSSDGKDNKKTKQKIKKNLGGETK